MIQYVSLSVKTSKDKKYNCWWCTLLIDNEPIGCPLSFKNDTYFIDGIFCSANCVKAYVLDRCQNDTTYKDSIRLLSLMVADMYNTKSPITIQPSPPWRFLTQYGGHVTPEKYRDLTTNTVFTRKGVIQTSPIVIMYEEDETY
jgi:hypothetical protein